MGSIGVYCILNTALGLLLGLSLGAIMSMLYGQTTAIETQNRFQAIFSKHLPN